MNKVYQRNYQNNSDVAFGSIGVKENKIIILNNIIQQPEATKLNLDQEPTNETRPVVIDLDANSKTDAQTNTAMTDIVETSNQLVKSRKKIFGK